MLYFLSMTTEEQWFLGYVILSMTLGFAVMGLGVLGHRLVEHLSERRLARSAAAHRRVLQDRVDPTLAHGEPVFEDTAPMHQHPRDAEDTHPPTL